ncbi:hypothetical protein [Citrobacter phage Tr1]|nr:hypothetical protein [Citrobacter phage Tr1]
MIWVLTNKHLSCKLRFMGYLFLGDSYGIR